MKHVNKVQKLLSHQNNFGVPLNPKIKKYLLMFHDNHPQLLEAFHSSNSLLQNKNLKNNQIIKLPLFLNMDKMNKSSNLQIQESLQLACSLLCP